MFLENNINNPRALIAQLSLVVNATTELPRGNFTCRAGPRHAFMLQPIIRKENEHCSDTGNQELEAETSGGSRLSSPGSEVNFQNRGRGGRCSGMQA